MTTGSICATSADWGKQMSELVDALDRLMLEHRRIGSPVPDFLLPGLDPAAIRARIVTLGLEAPDEAVELFAWHDGVDNDRYLSTGAGIGYARLFDDVFFGTLEEAIEYYGECLQIDRNVGSVYEDAEPTWRLSWFPPFSGGLPTYGIECRCGIARSRHGLRAVVSPAGRGTDPAAISKPTHLVQSVVRRFEADGYWWDGKVGFLMDRDAVLGALYEQERLEASRP